MLNLLTIARNTSREIFKQPAFIIVLLLGITAIVLGRYLTLFGLGQEVEMFKDIGCSTILFVGLILVVFASTSTIHDEIESRTMLTILSRPVRKSEVLVGKFAGILITVSIATLLLLIAFLVTHWWFLHNEYSHSAMNQPFFHPQIIKGVLLSLMQVILLAGVSVILSIYLGLLPNISICGIIFVIGHLSDYLFATFRDPLTGSMNVVAKFFYLLIPNFEHFNVSSALLNGSTIPWSFVGVAAIYTAAYLFLLLFTGILLFWKRELY